ncbi:hypothetical protein [Caenimonas koreensis]|uniref:Uncharacterized protein n=1 Tax=Caenimonas koreensis DSM 17982 TaxID=1121255 RepID=A0A844BE75_9BURK|nr:hypothetical protein [Caenimonas koreensis]MRD49737.1 hypothetical protein [Caenimonas koreensis DSM 17982]
MGMFSWLRRMGRPAGEGESSGFSRLDADSRFSSGNSGGHSQTARMSTKIEASGLHSTSNAPITAAARFRLRKDLIRMCLRDVLLKAGIPTEWILPEVLLASSRNGTSALHLRLRIVRWDDRIPGYALVIQRQFEQRILMMDPVAPEWISGISWQFALDDEPELPKLPHPSAWTRRPAPAEQPANKPMFQPTLPGQSQ